MILWILIFLLASQVVWWPIWWFLLYPKLEGKYLCFDVSFYRIRLGDYYDYLNFIEITIPYKITNIRLEREQ